MVFIDCLYPTQLANIVAEYVENPDLDADSTLADQLAACSQAWECLVRNVGWFDALRLVRNARV